MNTRTLWAVAAAVALLAVPACSSDSDAGTEAATTTTAETTTAAETSAAAEAAVTADELQTQLDILFDPATSVDAKAAVVEDGTDRLPVLAQFTGVLAGYPLTATVGEITPVTATTVTATTEVAGPHGGAPLPLTFTEVDDAWVLDSDSTCSIFELGRLPCR